MYMGVYLHHVRQMFLTKESDKHDDRGISACYTL